MNDLNNQLGIKTSNKNIIESAKNIDELEKCIKKNKNNELFKVDDDFVKDTILYCNKQSIKVKENKKLLKFDLTNNWLIIVDKSETNINDLFKEKDKPKPKPKLKVNKSTKKSSKTKSKKSSKK